MTSGEFYDVGKGKGRKEIDSSNRTQAYTRIQTLKESAVVVDHDNNTTEVWHEGKFGARYATGTRDASDVIRKLRGD